MTEALPKGIVLHSERISSEIESFGGVDAEDLAKLWRVYTTNRSTMKADEGRRLENLFWRIWSNNAILRTIQGTTLAGLFLHISEGESITRLGPARLREISTSIPRIQSRRRAAPSTASIQPQRFPTGASCKSTPNVSRKPSVNAARAPLPPPILKKPRQASNDAQRPPGVSTVGATERVTEINTSLSASPAAVLEARLGESVSEKPRRKKATFASNITSMEAEPVPMPKKLSQPPSDLPPARHSPTACSRGTRDSPDLYGPSAPRRQIYPMPNESAISISPTPNPQARAYPWLGPGMQRPGPTSNPTSHPATAIAANPAYEQCAQQQKRSNNSPTSQPVQPSKVSLVEKDFRARFVEKRLQESRNSSFTNLSSSLLTQADIKASATTVASGNPDTVRSRKLQSSGDAEPVMDVQAARGRGKVKEGGGGHSTVQKRHPSRNNGTVTKPVGVDYVQVYVEDDEDGEWEDIDSDDDPLHSISPSTSQLQSPHQQGVPAARPSLGQQQSQLSEMIERERKLSATMQK
ncbi:hypothetical protein ACJ73_08639 [Blastomyces percursus]|uniref:Nitrogen regulatory protein areA GATA-like domain-containing protein n=1 Tax=Blastomyces percursus TaxID=1658174 RepID=A0A1J9QVY6_9EURO|nr:hypothetical protein ACJ73_08639 [Blastomyces percursus]